jgi:hypothetical protein
LVSAVFGAVAASDTGGTGAAGLLCPTLAPQAKQIREVGNIAAPHSAQRGPLLTRLTFEGISTDLGFVSTLRAAISAVGVS